MTSVYKQVPFCFKQLYKKQKYNNSLQFNEHPSIMKQFVLSIIVLSSESESELTEITKFLIVTALFISFSPCLCDKPPLSNSEKTTRWALSDTWDMTHVDRPSLCKWKHHVSKRSALKEMNPALQ